LNDVEENGDTALHGACMWNRYDVVRYLCSEGANVFCLNSDLNNALHVSAIFNSSKAAKELINHVEYHSPGDFQIFLDARNSKGETPILLACKADAKEISSRLIGKGANVDIVDHNGTSPLMAACKNDNIDFVMLLLGKGADKDFVDNQGKSAKLLTTDPKIYTLSVKNGKIKF